VHIVPDVLPRSLCCWPRTSLHFLEKRHNHLIVHFAYLCHMLGEELVFFPFLYIKLFQLSVEVACNKKTMAIYIQTYNPKIFKTRICISFMLRTHATHACTHACMHASMHARTHACTHARMDTPTHARTHAHTRPCTHARKYTCSCVLV